MSALALRTELDRLRCSEPGCDCGADGVVLTSVCHPDDPMWASYRHGELTLTCVVCDAPVVTIAVAG
jgi:hypothetical protein